MLPFKRRNSPIVSISVKTKMEINKFYYQWSGETLTRYDIISGPIKFGCDPNDVKFQIINSAGPAPFIQYCYPGDDGWPGHLYDDRPLRVATCPDRARVAQRAFNEWQTKHNDAQRALTEQLITLARK